MGADSDAVFQSGDQSHQDASILHVIKNGCYRRELFSTFCGDDQTVEWYPVHPDGQEQAWQDACTISDRVIHSV